MSAKLQGQIHNVLGELSKAKDTDIPLLLLQIRQILEDNLSQLQQTKTLLWENELFSSLADVLQQDFTRVQGGWATAADLTTLLSRCCGGFNCPSTDFSTLFLPLVLDRIMEVAESIQSSTSSLKAFKTSLDSVVWLVESDPTLAQGLVESPRLLKMLMQEGEAKFSQCVLKVVRAALLALPNIASVDEDKLMMIIEEILLLLTNKNNPSTQQISANVLYNIANKHDKIQVLLLDYFNQLEDILEESILPGIVDDISVLISFMRECLDKEGKKKLLNSSATKIQSCYRGYATRQQIKRATQRITKFQLKYREHLSDKKERESRQREEELNREMAADKARSKRRHALAQRAAEIRTIPASKLHQHQNTIQNRAAGVIQRNWRLYSAKRELDSLREHRERARAATLIQHHYRKFRGHDSWSRLPPGLNPARITELHGQIEALVKSSPSFNEQQASEDMILAQEMYTTYCKSQASVRQVQKRREFLCQQVSDRLSVLANCPTLANCTTEDVLLYQIHDPVIVTQARAAHRAKLAQRSAQEYSYDSGSIKPSMDINLDIHYSPLTNKIKSL